MSMWSMLSFMESAEANSKLDDMKKQNEIDKQNAKEQEINKNISSLFQDIYNNDNDITKVNLSNVSFINNLVNEKFNYLKNKSRPKHNYFGLLGIVILIALELNIYEHSGITLLFIVFGIILGLLALNAWADEKNIEEYKNTKAWIDGVLISFKQKHYTLSAYGIYFKFYLDQHFQDIKNILNNSGRDKDINMTIYSLYKIFNLNASVGELQKWEYDVLLNFNKDIIEQFNNISISDEILYQDKDIPQKLSGNSFKANITNNTIDLEKIDIKISNEILQINPNFMTTFHDHYDIPRISISKFKHGNKDNFIEININNEIIKNNSQEIFREIDNIKKIVSNNKKQLISILDTKKQIQNEATKFIKQFNDNFYVSIYSYIDFGVMSYSITIGNNAEDEETKYFELDNNGNIKQDEITELTLEDKNKIIEYFRK